METLSTCCLFYSSGNSLVIVTGFLEVLPCARLCVGILSKPVTWPQISLSSIQQSRKTCEHIFYTNGLGSAQIRVGSPDLRKKK